MTVDPDDFTRNLCKPMGLLWVRDGDRVTLVAGRPKLPGRREALRAAGRTLVTAWPRARHLAAAVVGTLGLHLLDALTPRSPLLRPLCRLLGHQWRTWEDLGPWITCYTCGKVIHEDDLAA